MSVPRVRTVSSVPRRLNDAYQIGSQQQHSWQQDGSAVQDESSAQGLLQQIRPRYSVNPQLLEQIASMTGGTPYLASDSRALRDRFQKILAELKKAPIRDRDMQHPELYRRFVLVAFALLALEIALRLTRFSRIP